MNNEIKKEADCIFCKIIAGEIPSNKVYEDESFMAILDVCPANRGHVIILPKMHAANIFELPEELAGNIFLIAKKIAQALKSAYRCDGINILQNNGEAAGQTVFHLHVHVIPRYKDDMVSVEWVQKEIDDFEAVKKEIRQELQRGRK